MRRGVLALWLWFCLVVWVGADSHVLYFGPCRRISGNLTEKHQTYWVYRYQVDGQRYEGIQSGASPEKVGRHLEIYVSQAHPETSWILSNGTEPIGDIWGAMTLLGPVFLLGVVLLAVDRFSQRES